MSIIDIVQRSEGGANSTARLRNLEKRIDNEDKAGSASKAVASTASNGLDLLNKKLKYDEATSRKDVYSDLILGESICSSSTVVIKI